VMHMDDLRLRRVVDLVAGVHQARGPFQIL
jgi:hypothetical protein